MLAPPLLLIPTSAKPGSSLGAVVLPLPPTATTAGARPQTNITASEAAAVTRRFALRRRRKRIIGSVISLGLRKDGLAREDVPAVRQSWPTVLRKSEPRTAKPRLAEGDRDNDPHTLDHIRNLDYSKDFLGFSKACQRPLNCGKPKRNE